NRDQQPEKDRPTIRGKVIVWDLSENEPRRAQRLLRPDLQAGSASGKITVVAGGRVEREAGTTYNNGEPGYQQKGTVRLVAWPEKRHLGSFVVKSAQPPLFVSDRDPRPICGDLDRGLADWINSLPVDSSGQ